MSDNRLLKQGRYSRTVQTAMLLVSDKYDLVNKRTQEISELMKLGLHIQGVWQNAHKVIRQLAH